jgi:uncharacterized protein YoxC
METIVFCLATAAVSIVAVSFYFTHNRKSLVHTLSETTQALRNLEKEIHQKETNILRERNKFESDLNAKMQESLEQMKQTGVLLGRADAAKDHEIALKELGLAHRESISKERTLAAEEAKAAQKAEFEQQVKLFSVKISPYVSVVKDSGLIFNSCISQIGYQYQLLVNGIPAFAPHITIENTEETREVDKAALEKYIETAVHIANKAADTYLQGARAGAVHIADAVVSEVKKK